MCIKKGWQSGSGRMYKKWCVHIQIIDFWWQSEHTVESSSEALQIRLRLFFSGKNIWDINWDLIVIFLVQVDSKPLQYPLIITFIISYVHKLKIKSCSTHVSLCDLWLQTVKHKRLLSKCQSWVFSDNENTGCRTDKKGTRVNSNLST